MPKARAFLVLPLTPTPPPYQAILETYDAYNKKGASQASGPTANDQGSQIMSQAPLPVASSLLPSPAVSLIPAIRPGQAPPVTQRAPVILGPAAAQEIGVARNGKKRIKPTNLGGNSSAGLLSAAGSGVFGGQSGQDHEVILIDLNGNKQQPPLPPALSQPYLSVPSAGASRSQSVPRHAESTVVSTPNSLTPLASPEPMDVDHARLAATSVEPSGWVVDSDSRPGLRAPSVALGKRKAVDDGPLVGGPPPSSRIKGRTLGEGIKRSAGVERELVAAGQAVERPASVGGGGDVLDRLAVRSVVKARAEDGDWIEARNSLSGTFTPLFQVLVRS